MGSVSLTFVEVLVTESREREILIRNFYQIDRKKNLAMASVFADFKAAQTAGSGPQLAAAITPTATPEDPDRLRSFYNSTNSAKASTDIRHFLLQDRTTGVKLPKQEGNAWVNIFTAFWTAAGEIVKLEESSPEGSWSKVFEAWKEVANQLIRGYSTGSLQAWTVPCLYVVGKYLRAFAIKADAESSQDPGSFGNGFQDDVVANVEKNAQLEEAARTINRMFTLCLSDRNVLRALDASSGDIPDFDAFPKSHIVTFKYYVGVICFLEENYAEAEEHLTQAWQMCHKDAYKNRELILTYLVPCHIVTTHTLPSRKLLEPFPRLENLFRPLCQCIKRGDLVGFDAAMSAGADEFVKRRIYLPLERGRDLALRNLFRKVFLAGGYDEPKDGQPPIRRTRVPVAEFAAALRIGTKAEEKSRVDMDEVECLLSSLIYKNLMKGYISRERATVVLSKNDAFPGTGV
ncbi:hypothetical protein T310_0877 [Rasamsonia emersonii CBS 393.64]|uniref:Protein CSN12 homolog n=1 Tax=Rasamsonia emersonii (strain ATCC 16479 / CBS 393.64 / IMI 116815) TaxID=1408163 RepID=A0A0F4Z3C5_RASE3|nr:hypothetical protein T310_0877 [Rasamsonia emersonii CBS 393.64]KKA25012.1 hypothetical protein T310_0877 [Rasamsonia emersonii CBS 393.64]